MYKRQANINIKKQSVIDSDIEKNKNWNLVAEHVGIATMCSTTKFTVTILALVDV